MPSLSPAPAGAAPSAVRGGSRSPGTFDASTGAAHVELVRRYGAALLEGTVGPSPRITARRRSARAGCPKTVGSRGKGVVSISTGAYARDAGAARRMAPWAS